MKSNLDEQIKKVIHNIFRKLCNIFAGSGFGKNKAVSILYHRLLPKFRPDKVTVGGDTLFLDKADSMSLSVFGVYEPEVGCSINNEVKNGMIAVDLGANIGYFTLMLAKKVGNNGRVYAFEPDPENFRLLKKNIKANGCKNVVAVKAAIAEKKGKRHLYLDSNNPAENSIYNINGTRRSILVNCWSLDQYFRDKNRKVDFIKMDIQGAEGEALKGAINIINNNPKIKLLTEVWPPALLKSDIDVDQYLSMFELFGFKISLLQKNTGCRKKIISRQKLLLYVEKNQYANVLFFR